MNGLTVTTAAAEHIRKQLRKRGKGIGLRIGVKTTGCSGLSYRLEYADEIAENDQCFQSNEVTIVVDSKSLPYLQGTELDFAIEGLKQGFRFQNPNAKNACGCGESFAV